MAHSECLGSTPAALVPELGGSDESGRVNAKVETKVHNSVVSTARSIVFSKQIMQFLITGFRRH